MSKNLKMSVHEQEFAEEEFEKHYIVFEGSSPEDVFHAKLLWNSLSLSPPQESRLESSDIHQRLPVARSRRDTSAIFRAIPELKAPPINSSQRLQMAQRQEEREKCSSMAKQKGEIQDLLLKQREQRIQKEKASRPFKLKQGDGSKSAGNDSAKHSKDYDFDEVKLL